jgi:hypothetical protein
MFHLVRAALYLGVSLPGFFADPGATGGRRAEVQDEKKYTTNSFHDNPRLTKVSFFATQAVHCRG